MILFTCQFSPFCILYVLARLAFIEDYTLKSLRLKTEKWNKLVISDDQRGFLHSFVDQGELRGASWPGLAALIVGWNARDSPHLILSCRCFSCLQATTCIMQAGSGCHSGKGMCLYLLELETNLL